MIYTLSYMVTSVRLLQLKEAINEWDTLLTELNLFFQCYVI